MNYPRDLASRLTRAGNYVAISRYRFTGYWEVTKEVGGYYQRRLFDTGRDAWAYYRTNKTDN
jgi:ADP-glucose pyrophosphorylase